LEEPLINARKSAEPAGTPTVIAVRESCRPKNSGRPRGPGFKKMVSFDGLDLWVRTDVATAS
jgi:hypothetical protein